VTCYAWPLAVALYCAAHDPRELERRREARAAPRRIFGGVRVRSLGLGGRGDPMTTVTRIGATSQ